MLGTHPGTGWLTWRSSSAEVQGREACLPLPVAWTQDSSSGDRPWGQTWVQISALSLTNWTILVMCLDLHKVQFPGLSNGPISPYLTGSWGSPRCHLVWGLCLLHGSFCPQSGPVATFQEPALPRLAEFSPLLLNKWATFKRHWA